MTDPTVERVSARTADDLTIAIGELEHWQRTHKDIPAHVQREVDNLKHRLIEIQNKLESLAGVE